MNIYAPIDPIFDSLKDVTIDWSQVEPIDSLNSSFNVGEYNPMYGVKHSAQTKKLMSKNNSNSNNPRAKVIQIYNNDSVLQYTCNGNFVIIRKSNNLPWALKASYQNNGERIYQKQLNNVPKDYYNFYSGWYAISI